MAPVTLMEDVITFEEAERLRLSGVGSYHVDIFSLNPKLHNILASQASFGSSKKPIGLSYKSTISSIESLHHCGIRIQVRCILTEENIGGFYALEAWCNRHDLQLHPVLFLQKESAEYPRWKAPSRARLRWFLTELAYSDELDSLGIELWGNVSEQLTFHTLVNSLEEEARLVLVGRFPADQLCTSMIATREN